MLKWNCLVHLAIEMDGVRIKRRVSVHNRASIGLCFVFVSLPVSCSTHIFVLLLAMPMLMLVLMLMLLLLFYPYFHIVSTAQVLAVAPLYFLPFTPNINAYTTLQIIIHCSLIRKMCEQIALPHSSSSRAKTIRIVRKFILRWNSHRTKTVTRRSKLRLNSLWSLGASSFTCVRLPSRAVADFFFRAWNGWNFFFFRFFVNSICATFDDGEHLVKPSHPSFSSNVIEVFYLA